jgi:hypothetical protein
MQPLLPVLAFGVFAHKKVVPPLRITQRIGVQGAGNMGFATTAELAFSSGAAPGAGDL